jgi:hypothetical protein
MHRLLWWIAAAACVGGAYTKQANRTDFDCPMRQFMLERAATIQPKLFVAGLHQIADALAGDKDAAPNCTLTVPSAIATDARRRSGRFNIYPLPPAGATTFFVDPLKGSDTAKGNKDAPLKSISAAVAAARKAAAGSKYIVLRGGMHRLGSSAVQLEAVDSGLTIQGYPNEEAWLTAASQLAEVGTTWKAYNVTNCINTSAHLGSSSKAFLQFHTAAAHAAHDWHKDR